MEFDQSSMVKVVSVITPTDGAAAGATVVGAVIDVNQDERFEALTYLIHAGTITTGDFTVLLEESDTGAFGGEETTVPLDEVVNGVLPDFAVTDDDTVARVGLFAKKQHQRLTLVGSNTPVGDFSVEAVLGHPHVAPVAAQQASA